MTLKPGDVIGAYRIGQEVGRGGRAVVYRAWQRTTGRWVALKVLRRRDAEVLKDFHREARLTANIGHSCVRKVYEVGRTPGGYPFLAMQFVDLSLRRLLRDRQERGQTFSREEVASLLGPVAEVLDHMHRRGLVHLDIKPENILIFRDGQAVLADFGSVRRIGSTTHEGTPRYFSPEQAAGDRPVSPRSDIYSLAVVAYEMLTGRPPFLGERDIILVRQHLEDAPPSLHQVNAHLPRKLGNVIRDALSKDPSLRPVSACAFVDAIEQAQDGKRIGTSMWERLRVGWRAWMWALVGLVPVILIVVGFIVVRSCVSPPTSVPTLTSTPTRTLTLAPSATPTAPPSPTATATAAIVTSTPRPTSTPTATPTPATPTPTPTEEGEGTGGAGSAWLMVTDRIYLINRQATPRSTAKGERHGS